MSAKESSARLKLNLQVAFVNKNLFQAVSSMNSSQIGKALPVKTSKPNIVTFVYFGNSLFDYMYLRNFFVCYGSKKGKRFCS